MIVSEKNIIFVLTIAKGSSRYLSERKTRLKCFAAI